MNDLYMSYEVCYDCYAMAPHREGEFAPST